ncbi:centromere protein Chl4/mis15/CENP-N [Limtongia smithiae]|uniref:centromere protein Chl4/mis15/CENP-N n=1 Tax=Limtongia smithiae TaxID=1125753 RepID=UPI0034CFE74C
MHQDDSIIAPKDSHTWILMRMSRDTLIELVMGWLDLEDNMNWPHHIGEDDEDERRYEDLEYEDIQERRRKRAIGEDENYNAICRDAVMAVRGAYEFMQEARYSKKEITERMVNVDWSRGFNMRQVANIEFEYLFEKPLCMKWTASAVSLISPNSTGSHDKERMSAVLGLRPASLSTVHAPTFVKHLKRALHSLIDNHVHVIQHRTLPLALVRIQLHDSRTKAMQRGRYTVFCAIPVSPQHIFNTPFLNPFQTILRECIETSISMPGLQVRLEATSLTARSLETLLSMRTTNRMATALGGWSVYARNEVDASPLESAEKVVADQIAAEAKELDAEQDHEVSGTETRRNKRARTIDARFGAVAVETENPEVVGTTSTSSTVQVAPETALTHVEFRVENDCEVGRPGETITVTPKVRMVFDGTHVFEGLRLLAQKGCINTSKMPQWMTGELGVSVGVISRGDLVRQND